MGKRGFDSYNPSIPNLTLEGRCISTEKRGLDMSKYTEIMDELVNGKPTHKKQQCRFCKKMFLRKSLVFLGINGDIRAVASCKPCWEKHKSED